MNSGILSFITPDLITIISAILMILLDILVIGLGAIYLLWGFINGTRKSLRRALSFLIPFIIFICCIDLITKLLINADWSVFVSMFEPVEGPLNLKELGIQLLANNIYNGNIDAASSSKIIELAEALVSTVVRSVVYVVGLLVIAFLVAPFIRFITWLCYKIQTKGMPKQKKTMASRFAGMGIASVRFTLVFLIVIMPMYGTISTFDMLLEDAINVVDVFTEEDEQNLSGEVNLVKDMLEAADKGLDMSLSRFLSNLSRGKNDEASVDMKYFGQLFAVSTTDGTLNVLDEYGRIHSSLPVFVKVAETCMNEDQIEYTKIMEVLNEEDVDIIENLLAQSKAVELLLPVGYDYLTYYLEDSGITKEYGITKEELESIEINKDFDLIVDAVMVVFDVMVTENITFETEEELIEILLTNDKINKGLETCISDLLDTTTVEYIGLPLAVRYIHDALDSTNDESLIALKDMLTKEDIKTYLRYDITGVADIAKKVYLTDLKEIINAAIRGEDLSSIYVDLSDPEITSAIEYSITHLLGLKIIHGHENMLLKALFTSLVEEGVEIDEILFDENGNSRINWDNESNVISSLVVDILEVFGNDLLVSIEDPTKLVDILLSSDDARSIIEDITNSDIAKALVVTLLYDYIVGEESIPSNLKAILTKEALLTCFEEDILSIADAILDIYKTDLKELFTALLNNEKVTVENIDFEDEQLTTSLEKLLDTLLNLTIIKGSEEALLEYVINLIGASSNVEINAKEILYQDGQKYINWDLEKSYIIDSVIGLVKITKLDVSDQDVSDWVDILANSPHTETVIKSITSSIVIKNIVAELTFNAVQKEKLPEELKSILTKEAIIQIIENDFIALFNIIKKINNSPIKEDILNLITSENKFEPDFTDPSVQSIFKEVIIDIFNLSIIDGNEEILIKSLLSNIGGFDINLDDILYDDLGNTYINWDIEVSVLCDALIEVINIFGTDFTDLSFEIFKEKLLNDKEKTSKFVDIISESEIVRKVILDKLPGIIKSASLPAQIKDFFTLEKFEKLEEKEIFKKEVKLLLDVVIDFLSLDITDFSSFEINKENEELLKQTLLKAIESTFIKGEEKALFELFINSTNFNETLENNGITLDLNKVTNWHNELVISIDIAISFIDIAGSSEFALEDLFKGNMSEEEINKVSVLFDQIGQSEIFKPIVYQLIDKVGYDISLTETDKVNIEENGFGKEISTLLGLLGEAQGLLEESDLSTLEGSSVEQIMLKASEGIITSKVVGTLLETALGKDGLDILPLDDSGNYKYDFKDPNVLKEQATNIGNLVDIANKVNNFNINESTSITDITNAIKDLESNELAEDMLKEITGVEIDLESTDISEEATLIEDVYNEYKNSSDKDNFIPSEEAIEKLEDSNLASTILEMLGIIK